MKVGNLVVSSQDIDGRSKFVQNHEFALFSQKTGLLEVPAISVRFAGREGFTGPAVDVQAQVPGWKVEIRRPPGGIDVYPGSARTHDQFERGDFLGERHVRSPI